MMRGRPQSDMRPLGVVHAHLAGRCVAVQDGGLEFVLAGVHGDADGLSDKIHLDLLQQLGELEPRGCGELRVRQGRQGWRRGRRRRGRRW
eukprot:3904357-Prymnesium_polylepis.3